VPDVTPYDDRRWLGTLADDWHAAIARTTGDRPLAGLGWYRTALDEAVVDVEPRVLVVSASESLLGIVPFVVEHRPTWLGAARVLRFPSDATGFRCGALGPHPGTALTFALRWLARRNDWDVLRLDDPENRPRTRTALRLAGLRFSWTAVPTRSTAPAPRLHRIGEAPSMPTADRYVVWRPRSPRGWLLARDTVLDHWLHAEPLLVDGAHSEAVILSDPRV
jgi:hypothetical protein